MTEAEWKSSTDPAVMLAFIQPNEEARKTRLFKCACCRRVWHLLTDKRSREGVVLAERIADGEVVDEEELSRTVEGARAVRKSKKFWQRGGPHDPLYSLYTAAETAADTTANKGFNALGIASWTGNAMGAEAEASAKARPYSKRGKVAFEAAHKQAFSVLCDYIRDIFGPLPFRSVALDFDWLAWNDRTIPRMAQTVYDERAFDRLAVLADALEDAGCDNEDILSHLPARTGVARPRLLGCRPHPRQGVKPMMLILVACVLPSVLAFSVLGYHAGKMIGRKLGGSAGAATLGAVFAVTPAVSALVLLLRVLSHATDR